MGDREIYIEPELQCDVCGTMGAYDFMGDSLCPECVKKYMGIDKEANDGN